MICIYRKADGLIMMVDAQYRPNELCDNTVYDLGDYTGVTIPADWIDPIIVPAEEAVYDESGTLVKEAVEERVIPNPFIPRNITDLVNFQPRHLLEQAQAESTAAQAEADAKEAARLAIKNRYLDICEQLTGSRTKLGFTELNAVLQPAIESGDLATAHAADKAFKALVAVQAEGQRMLGLNWWDLI